MYYFMFCFGKRRNMDGTHADYFLFQGHVFTEMREVSNILYQISSNVDIT